MTEFERASAANVCVLRNPIDQTFCGVAGGSKRNCSNTANLIIPLAHRPASVHANSRAARGDEHNKRTTQNSISLWRCKNRRKKETAILNFCVKLSSVCVQRAVVKLKILLLSQQYFLFKFLFSHLVRFSWISTFGKKVIYFDKDSHLKLIKTD